MKKFTYTDLFNNIYDVSFFKETILVYSQTRCMTYSDGSFRPTYVKMVYIPAFKFLRSKILKVKLKYELDSSDLVNFIMKIFNNKAFW